MVQHHLADLQRPFLRYREEARGEDVHARLEVQQARRVVDRRLRRRQRLPDQRRQRRQRAVDPAEARGKAEHHRQLIDVALRRRHRDLRTAAQRQHDLAFLLSERRRHVIVDDTLLTMPMRRIGSPVAMTWFITSMRSFVSPLWLTATTTSGGRRAAAERPRKSPGSTGTISACASSLKNTAPASAAWCELPQQTKKTRPLRACASRTAARKAAEAAANSRTSSSSSTPSNSAATRRHVSSCASISCSIYVRNRGESATSFACRRLRAGARSIRSPSRTR